MSFFMEDSGLIIPYLLYKTALIIAVLKWALTWALRFRTRHSSSDPLTRPSCSSSSSSSTSVSSQMIRDNLALTTFADVTDRLPWVSDTCAVCLSQMRDADEVRELRNCCHVFHRECIDRWVDYDHDHDDDHDDNHKTCPLCRAPLLASSHCMDWPRSEPSWAVERLLYLFGDDLLV